MRSRERFRQDRQRYYDYAGSPQRWWQKLNVIWHAESLWAIGLYRFGYHLRHEAPRWQRRLLAVPYHLTLRLLRLVLGVAIHPDTEIGPGLYIGHRGGVWINPSTVIGANCNLSHGVTMGVGGTVRRGTPVLGDRVWVGPQATLSGPIQVGRGAVVAANSLVVQDVPENGVVIGVPARVVSYGGSDALIDGSFPPPPLSLTATDDVDRPARTEDDPVHAP